MKLAHIADAYIAHKRSLGMRFDTPARILKTFCRVFGPVDADQINHETVEAFLNRSRPVSPSWHLKYYTLRGLFRFAIERGMIAASPMPHFLPKRPAYAKPYIYSPDELRRLLKAADILDVRHPKNGQAAGIPARTFRTLILLLYGTGLRLGEALRLMIDDVDLAAGCLVVRNTKFFKTRLVPLGPKLASMLADYAGERVALSRRPSPAPAFFLSRRGKAIPLYTAERCFKTTRERVGLTRRDGAYFQPRLHDLRHTFAVHRLEAWYRSGADVQLLLPKLSTYLGHFGLAETQHYLTMTPELLREASRRFESYANLEGDHDQ